MKIIIDSRMRMVEKEYLSEFGELIELPCQDCVYEEISAHPDVFFCMVNDTVFRSPDINMNIGIAGKKRIIL